MATATSDKRKIAGLAGYNAQAGFTLLEIIIVFFLMTMILGLSTVYFVNRLPAAKFDATAREIMATVRHARSLAMANSETKTVTIDIDQRRYGIDGLGVRNIPEDIGIKVRDPFSGEVLKGKYRLTFQAGGAAGGGTIIIWSDKRSQSIQLDPVVGAVAIKGD